MRNSPTVTGQGIPRGHRTANGHHARAATLIPDQFCLTFAARLRRPTGYPRARQTTRPAEVQWKRSGATEAETKGHQKAGAASRSGGLGHDCHGASVPSRDHHVRAWNAQLSEQGNSPGSEAAQGCRRQEARVRFGTKVDSLADPARWNHASDSEALQLDDQQRQQPCDAELPDRHGAGHHQRPPDSEWPSRSRSNPHP